MTRYERKLFFEQLVTLRDAYRAERQVTVELAVDAIPVFAEAMYNALADAESVPHPMPAGGAGSTPPAAD
jgi:hypothetical protein